MLNKSSILSLFSRPRHYLAHNHINTPAVSRFNLSKEPPKHQFQPEAIQAAINQLPYFVARTAVGKNLPIYTDYKAGGTKRITIVRRVYGHCESLKADIERALPGVEVTVRSDRGHVIIKGHYLGELRAFLTYQGF